MKRVGNLWPQVVSFENLHGAAKAAARGKRSRPDVAYFLLNLEPELVLLQRELETGDYQPGNYRTFQVHEPKPRFISAAPFRDRVVHHALTQVLEPIFERRFVMNSFACRKGTLVHSKIERRHRHLILTPYQKTSLVSLGRASTVQVQSW
jgi:RNA-directed DNA polymerase